MANLVREVFYTDSTWTAPAGVTQVTVKKIPISSNNLLSPAPGVGSGGSGFAINSCCDGYAWGNNVCGALGIGSITVQCKPNCICNSHKWQTIASGGDYAVGVELGTGNAYAWGNNSVGQLGVGTITVQCLPLLVCCGNIYKKIFTNFAVESVYGITCNNLLTSWGCNQCGVLGVNSITAQCLPQPVCCGLVFRDIFLAGQSAFGITALGNCLFAWGNNICGQLGIGSITVQCQPQPVCCLAGIKKVFGATNSGAAASNSIFALDLNNCLWSWGANNCGALGIGSITAQCKPQPVCCGIKFKDAAASADNGAMAAVVGIKTDNTLVGWGNNAAGQLGIGSITVQCLPQPVCGGFVFSKVSAGAFGTFFGISTSMTGYGWGCNNCGLVGNGAITAVCCPTAISTVRCYFTITPSCNLFNTVFNVAFAIDTAGCGYSWGDNRCGMLGINTITVQCCPIAICCGFSFFNKPPAEVQRAIMVTPGTVYAVGVSGSYQTFGGESVSNDLFTEAIAIEYFA